MKIHGILSAKDDKKILNVLVDSFLGKGTLKGGLAKAGASLVGLFGDNAVNSCIERLKPALTEKMNEFLAQKGIYAHVTAETIEKEGESMRITFDIDGINYESIICAFLPQILAGLKEKYPDSFFWSIYDVIEDDKDTLIKAVLGNLTDEQKDRIVIILAEQYNENIKRSIEKFFAEQEIELQINKITVEQPRS